MQISILFIFLLSLFLSSISTNLQLYGECEYYTYQTTVLLLCMCLFWFGVALVPSKLIIACTAHIQ